MKLQSRRARINWFCLTEPGFGFVLQNLDSIYVPFLPLVIVDLITYNTSRYALIITSRLEKNWL